MSPSVIVYAFDRQCPWQNFIKNIFVIVVATLGFLVTIIITIVTVVAMIIITAFIIVSVSSVVFAVLGRWFLSVKLSFNIFFMLIVMSMKIFVQQECCWSLWVFCRQCSPGFFLSRDNWILIQGDHLWHACYPSCNKLYFVPNWVYPANHYGIPCEMNESFLFNYLSWSHPICFLVMFMIFLDGFLEKVNWILKPFTCFVQGHKVFITQDDCVIMTAGEICDEGNHRMIVSWSKATQFV